MRLLKQIPEIDHDLDAGRLSLTVAAQIHSAFRQEDLRRKKSGQAALSEDEQRTVLADLMSTSTRTADRKLATHFPSLPPPEQTKPISESVTRIGFNADSGLMKERERLQAVYHHQTGGQWEKLFDLLADHEIEKLDAAVRRARGITQKRTRYVRKSIRQEVWTQWEQGCDHVLDNGERCGSRKNLQTDHFIEYCRGDTNDRENLRLLCGPHNRYRSDRCRQFEKYVEQTRLAVLEQTRN